MNTYTLKISEIRKETEDTVTLCFKQPALRKIKYEAGQYLTLIFRINGRRYIRPYSFSSAPGIDALLEVTIKRVPNGIVSNHIHDIVRVNDNIEVMSPLGDFIYNGGDSFQSVFLWGAGSGITPLISIAKFILANYATVQVYLIYGNRNYESTIFLDQIRQMEITYQNQFSVRHFHTKRTISRIDPSVVEGRIEYKNAMSILETNNALIKSAHYICGPLGLKESVKTALTSADVNLENVFSENFERLKDPADFEEINTQLIKLNFNGQVVDLEVIKGKSILESALDANIEMPYSCQTGNCSTCKGVIKEGAIKMIGLVKEREDLAADECLLCCTHPISENVYVIV